MAADAGARHAHQHRFVGHLSEPGSTALTYTTSWGSLITALKVKWKAQRISLFLIKKLFRKYL